jgi:hypothetical protein
MKEYILSLLPRLSKFSKGLNNSAILVDKPWIYMDEQGQQTKFVFRPNQELIVSNNGVVQKGRWEYLTAMDALLIEHGNHTQLFSQSFIDKGLLILNLDNTLELFVLINCNVIPDLDVVKYLGKIIPADQPSIRIEANPPADYYTAVFRDPALKVIIYPKNRDDESYSVGSRVVNMQGLSVPDGTYKAENLIKVVVENGIIKNVTYSPISKIIVAIVVLFALLSLKILFKL